MKKNVYSLYLDEIPYFEAISYVWGTIIQNQPITWNGKVICITTAEIREELATGNVVEKEVERFAVGERSQ
jgi:hypothetical protein